MDEQLKTMVVTVALMTAMLVGGLALTGIANDPSGNDGGSTDKEDAAGVHGQALPDDLEMDGATVVHRNATSITWRWEGTAEGGVLNPLTRVRPLVEARFDVPADLMLHIDAGLSWEDDGTPSILEFYVLDDHDGWRCYLVGNFAPPSDRCSVFVHPPLDGRERWALAVGSGAEPDADPVAPAQDFVAHLTLSIADVEPPVAVAHRADGVPAAYDGPLPTAELHETGTTTWEPTLGIDEEGAIFYQGRLSQQPYVVRSTDGGTTWDDVSPRVGDVYRHVIDVDPWVHVDRDTGRVFAADYQVQTGECSEVSFSDDQGDDWTTTLACGLNHRQFLFTGPPVLSPSVGYPNVVYLCAKQGGAVVSTLAYNAEFTGCLKSLDGGHVFVPTGEPAYPSDPTRTGDQDTPGKCGGSATDGTVGPGGTIYLARGWCGQPYIAISRDEGATWERVQVADNGMATGTDRDQSTRAWSAVDSAGNVYVTWPARDRLPYLAVSTDGGQTWSDPVMIGPPGLTEAWSVEVAAGGPGKIAVSYMGSRNAPGGDPSNMCTDVLECTLWDELGAPEPEGYEDATWSGYIMITDDALAEDPIFLTSAVNPAADILKRESCGAAVCEDVGDFLDVTIGPDGTPWAAFVDAHGRGTLDFNRIGLVGRLVGGPSLL